MSVMKNSIVQRCAFLVNDVQAASKNSNPNRYPYVNHLLAYNYAVALEPLLEFTNTDKDGKIQALLYCKMFSHTAKHLIHKYNRHKSGFYKFRTWGIYDFVNNEGKMFPYVEYPRTEDVLTLKREVMNRTAIKVKDLEMDQALENLNIAAFNDFKPYCMMEFQKDFELAHVFWNVMIEFMVVAREKEAEQKPIEEEKAREAERLKDISRKIRNKTPTNKMTRNFFFKD